jgi:hypothetical protein
MRPSKCLILQTLLIVLFVFAACTKPNDTNNTGNPGNTGNSGNSDSTATTPPGVRLTLADTLKMMSGWWHPENPALLGWKKVYFGPDSVIYYSNDLSDYNMDGYAALWWPIRDTCMIFGQWGGFPILKLTKDTLIMWVLGNKTILSKYDTSLITSKPMFTIAGGGHNYGAVTVPAMSVALGAPNNIAVDATGNIFLNDAGYIRKIGNDGIISVFAGSGSSFGSDDGVPATAAAFHDVRDIAIDKAGNVYYVDYGRNAVRMISAANGIVSTIAGGNVLGAFSGDGGPAVAASLNGPVSIAIDALNNIYIADMNNYRIRKINAIDKTINTIAGTGVNKTDGDGGLAINAGVQPLVIRFDANQNLFVSSDWLIRKIAAGSGIISLVAGTASGDRGENVVATKALLNGVQGLAIDNDGNIYLSESRASRVRRIDAADGKIRTVAGTAIAGLSFEYHKHATLCQLKTPAGITFDKDGNLLIADMGNQRIRSLVCN